MVVATDHEEIADAAKRAGVRALMTSESHRCGTDRVAEAAARLQGEGAAIDVVVNLQGDEPFAPPRAIEQVAALVGADAPMATLARPLEAGELEDPSVVKVAVDRAGRALYFSRAPIGARREGRGAAALAHVGLYAYTPEFLARFAALEPTPLEQAERLEQLRALEHGHPIAVGVTRWRAEGIDTPEDLERARARLA